MIIISKHLTLNERATIQVGLVQNKTLGEIASELGKSCSTISREIRKHAVIKRSGVYGHAFNECKYRRECRETGICESKPNCVTKNCRFCKECNASCGKFIREVCSKLNHPPYVCNGCCENNKCTLEKKMYDAKAADNEYRTLLKESREGFNLTETEFLDIDNFVSERIDRGLSVYNIVHKNPDIVPCSESTIYRLIHSSTLNARAIDLPRAVRFKVRKGKKKMMKVDKRCTLNRTYADYEEFIAENSDIQITEMDSVEGKKGGKVLLTFMIRSCNMMLAFIRDRNTSQSVTDRINWLYETLPEETYQSLFGVLLTDNGTEFSNPSAIEQYGDTQRTRVFYCDPYSSYQKPKVENNHELIRKVIPKGTSIDHLTQEDIDLMMSHINSYARKSLGNISPTELFIQAYGTKVLHLLRQELIPNEKILLKPVLLKK